MRRGSADEAVVIVKPGACDPVVTSVRVKHRVRAKAGGGEGRNTKAVLETDERLWAGDQPEREPESGRDVRTGRIEGADH